MKNKKFLIGILVVVLLVTIGGGTFILSKNKTEKKAQTTQASIEDEVLEKISKEDLGLITTVRPDKKAIKFEIKNASDIESVEYQISYTKDVKGEEVPEGLIGEAKPENGKISIAYREFGTCSSGTCRFDKVVSDIKLTLKVTKTNGKAYQTRDTIPL